MTEALIKYYELECNEDERMQRDKAHSMEFLTTVRYFEKLFPKGAKVLDACAGTGAYSFYLAGQGYKVTAGDIVPYNVKYIEKKQSERKLLDNIYTGDILDLYIFEDESFDVVLCMGALYHLQGKEERTRAIKECLRVLKKGGILAVAYINRKANILYNCAELLENIDELMEYSKTGIKHTFYGSSPQEINKMMADVGIEAICNIATDGIGYTMYPKINNSQDKVFEKWLEYHYATCEDESTLGYSMHGMYFGRKVE